MADSIVITKDPGGAILINNAGDEYNLLPAYRLRKKDGKVQVLTDLGGVVDTLDPDEVEKVVFVDGSEVLIPDLATLYSELNNHFFSETSPDEVLLIDEDTAGQVVTTYIGAAIPGTLLDAERWQIKKMVVTPNGQSVDTAITFPEDVDNVSDPGFNHIWDDRLGLTYK